MNIKKLIGFGFLAALLTAQDAPQSTLYYSVSSGPSGHSLSQQGSSSGQGGYYASVSASDSGHIHSEDHTPGSNPNSLSAKHSWVSQSGEPHETEQSSDAEGNVHQTHRWTDKTGCSHET